MIHSFNKQHSAYPCTVPYVSSLSRARNKDKSALLPLNMEFYLFIVSISFFLLLTTGSAQTADLVALAKHEPQDYHRICPLPRCNTCPSVEELRAPGIGFALETSHG